MHLLLAAVVTVALGVGCSQRADAQTGPTPLTQPRTIVAFGDSLTSGHGLESDKAYPAVLDRMLQAAMLPFTVVNHGVSGDTTERALRRLDAALNASPAILIVALGANDALKGMPVSQVRANLERIIERAQERNVAVLLCGIEALPLYGWEYAVAFHRLFPALAEKYDVPFVPFLLDRVVANPEMLQPDFVHPNAAGAVQMARTIWPYLQPLAIKVAGLLGISVA